MRVTKINTKKEKEKSQLCSDDVTEDQTKFISYLYLPTHSNLKNKNYHNQTKPQSWKHKEELHLLAFSYSIYSDDLITLGFNHK